jgi:NTP pyrophosphatase (non-canonical NTP hydrolase)
MESDMMDDANFFHEKTEKNEPLACPVERGVMAHAFIEKCKEKFERKAKENNRSVEPWKDKPTAFLCERLMEEFKELIDAADGGDPKAIMDECKDVANFAWFIYEQARMVAEGS